MGVYPLDQIADAAAPRCEDPKLIIRVMKFEVTQLIWPAYTPYSNAMDGQTDRPTDDLQ